MKDYIHFYIVYICSEKINNLVTTTINKENISDVSYVIERQEVFILAMDSL